MGDFADDLAAAGDRKAQAFVRGDPDWRSAENPEDELHRIREALGPLAVLIDDGWRVGRDYLWRNDRFGGSFKTDNALRRVGSHNGEET